MNVNLFSNYSLYIPSDFCWPHAGRIWDKWKDFKTKKAQLCWSFGDGSFYEMYPGCDKINL